MDMSIKGKQDEMENDGRLETVFGQSGGVSCKIK